MTQIPVAGLHAELALGTAKLSSGVAEANRALGGLEQRFQNTGRKARKTGDDIDAGLAKGLRGAGGSAEVFAKRIDALAQKFNPLYAASKRYEREVGALNDALKLGAINQQLYEQNLERLNAELANGASGFSRAADQAQRFNGVANGMAAQTGNIAAQFQDIGVQLAGGQSPFLIALQQGTQLNGVFSQMGGGIRGVAAGLKGAFMSLVSPLSLITIGAIAAGGALVQWALSATTAAENTDRLTQAAERQKPVIEGLLSVLNELRSERQMIQLGVGTEAELDAMNEINRLALERVALENELAQLHAAANENLGVINMQEVERLNALIAQNAENRAQQQGLLESIQKERGRLEAAKLTEAAAQQLRSIMAQMNGIDISAPWRSVLGLINAAIQGANQLAKGSLVYSGRGGDPRQFGANPGQTNTFNVENFQIPTVSAGGGGGGGRVDAVAQEVERLNSAVSEGITPLQRYQSGIAELEKLKSKGLSESAYSQEVKRLNEELAGSNPLVNDLSDAFGNFVASGFKDFEGFAKSVGNMFKKLIAEMVATALRNRIMIGVGMNVQGGVGGMLGGGGGILGSAGSLLGGGGSGLFGGIGNAVFSGGTGSLGLPSFGGVLGGGAAVLGPLAVGGLLLGGLMRRRARRRAARQAAAEEAQAAAQERANLEARIVQLTGTTAELRAKELEALRPANRELQERIWKLEDEKRISEERKGLEEELLRLQGDVAELRRRELEALDPSNRALQENIWQLEDAAEATDRLNQALQDLSEEEFATALDFNRARGALASGIVPASAPASVQAALSSAVSGGATALGSMGEALLGNINSNIALLWKQVQKWDFDGLPKERV